MTKVVSIITLVGVLALSTAAQQKKSEQQAADELPSTKYQKHLSRTAALIATKTYPIGKLTSGGVFDVSVKVGWILGEVDKVYAATFDNRVVDFDQLKVMQDELDKVIEASDGFFDKVDATSLSYSSPTGFGVSYYTYNDSSGKQLRNLYLTFRGSYITQGPSTEPLVKLRSFVTQAREKLISLGAK